MSERHETPRVSLIICTTGRPDRIDVLQPRLTGVLDAAGADVEVIVVDNSRESMLELDDSRVRLIRCTTPGLSLARAAGCAAASGQVLVFTDDDVEFDAGWPLRIAAPVLEGRLDASAAPVRLGDEFAGIASVLRRQWLAEANLDGESRLVGAGMALDRRLLDVGVWDPSIGAGHDDFAFGEETLFEYMALAAGARVGVAPDAGVVHHPDLHRSSPDWWRRLARQKGLSNAYLAYHWSGETMRRTGLRVLRRRLRLALSGRRSTDVSDSELHLIESVGRAEGYHRLRGEPMKYFPRRTRSLPEADRPR